MTGFGRDLCGSPSPTPLPKQGHLEQAAQDHIQAGLEYLQRRRLHSLPGQPVPVLRHPQSEEILVQVFLCFYPTPVSWNHRIIEQLRFKGTFKGHLIETPCNEQGHLQLDHVAQSPIQPGLECFQGWGIYHHSRQPVPGFHHPNGKEFLPYI